MISPDGTSSSWQLNDICTAAGAFSYLLWGKEVWHVSVSCWSSTTVMPPCHPTSPTGDCTPLSSPELGGSEALRPRSHQRLPCLTPRRLETGRTDRRRDGSGAEEDRRWEERRGELSRRNIGYWFLVRNICQLGVTWLSFCLLLILPPIVTWKMFQVTLNNILNVTQCNIMQSTQFLLFLLSKNTDWRGRERPFLV